MLISFENMRETVIPQLNGGSGSVSAKMVTDPCCKIMLSRIPAGASIGLHQHTASSEINYVLDGTGKALCDGQEEELFPGVCHYCPKGFAHSITNTGNGDLLLFTVVQEAGA